MGRCSSVQGSKPHIFCSDADWGKTRLTQPLSTRLLSPSLEERVIFCSLSASSFLHYPSRLPLCSLASPLFCIPCFTHFSLFSFVNCSLLINLAFACYLLHFGTSVLASSTSPPPYHSASVYPFFRHVEPVKVISVLEMGGGVDAAIYSCFSE